MYLSQWTEKLRSRSGFGNSARTGEAYLPCTPLASSSLKIRISRGRDGSFLFNNSQCILFLSLWFLVRSYMFPSQILHLQLLGSSTTHRKAFHNYLYGTKNKTFLFVFHLPPASLIWCPLSILKDHLDVGWDGIVNTGLTILFGILYPFISFVILLYLVLSKWKPVHFKS